VSDNQLSILVIGAHPDDCEIKAGGLALKYRALGHRVKFVSMTNGQSGHQEMGGGALARRRRDEAMAAAKVAGIEAEVLDMVDGWLVPDLNARRVVIRIVRETRPDLVLCHRPNDYHPDHRAVGVLVQDASYLVTVPSVVPFTPHLDRMPVFGYLWDNFRKPCPFEATVAVDIGDVIERKIDMIHCHTSQMYEWLPFNGGTLDQVPEGEGERRAWLGERMANRYRNLADSTRATLKKWYGDARGEKVEFSEAVEISEYGSSLTDEDVPRLFPFFG